jgi:hypothetical protein
MTGAWGSLHVGVWKDEILITLPGTNYTVTYYKPANSPGLLAKNFPTKDDSRVPMTQAECGSRPPHHICSAVRHPDRRRRHRARPCQAVWFS